MTKTFLFELLAVGAGGAVGAVLRFLVSGWVHRLAGFSAFPWGTLAVNAAGCLAIGLLGGLADVRQIFTPPQRLFLLIGLLGGFTTFSTFAYESYALARSAEFFQAGLNVALQVVLGFLFAWIGYVGASALGG
jgi:CrcB protein